MGGLRISEETKTAMLRDYLNGMTPKEAAAKYDASLATVRRLAMTVGVHRDQAAAQRLASSKGRLSSRKGIRRGPYSKEVRAAMSAGRQRWATAHARGFSIKKSGRMEYTRGPNQGRLLHVVMMEERIGRRLQADECVHHIDGNPGNNEWNNLALCTFAGHSRLHRLQDAMAGKIVERKPNGTFK